MKTIKHVDCNGSNADKITRFYCSEIRMEHIFCVISKDKEVLVHFVWPLRFPLIKLFKKTILKCFKLYFMKLIKTFILLGAHLACLFMVLLIVCTIVKSS